MRVNQNSTEEGEGLEHSLPVHEHQPKEGRGDIANSDCRQHLGWKPGAEAARSPAYSAAHEGTPSAEASQELKEFSLDTQASTLCPLRSREESGRQR